MQEHGKSKELLWRRIPQNDSWQSRGKSHSINEFDGSPGRPPLAGAQAAAKARFQLTDEARVTERPAGALVPVGFVRFALLQPACKKLTSVARGPRQRLAGGEPVLCPLRCALPGFRGFRGHGVIALVYDYVMSPKLTDYLKPNSIYLSQRKAMLFHPIGYRYIQIICPLLPKAF